MARNELPAGVKLATAYRLAALPRLGQSQSAQLRCGIHLQPEGCERRFRTAQYALVYVYSGSGWFSDHRGLRYRLQPGFAFQRFPNQTHSVACEGPCLRCYVAVPCQIFEMLQLTGVVSLARPVFEVGVRPELVRGFDEIRAALANARDEQLAGVLLRMQELVLRVHQLGLRQSQPAAERLGQAVQWLSENLEQREALPELARRLNMSYSAFRQKFLARYGCAPREFRVRRRLERAMALLHERELTLKQIAELLGYSDVYALCAQFKKYVGMPPGTFRRQGRGG